MVARHLPSRCTKYCQGAVVSKTVPALSHRSLVGFLDAGMLAGKGPEVVGCLVEPPGSSASRMGHGTLKLTLPQLPPTALTRFLYGCLHRYGIPQLEPCE